MILSPEIIEEIKFRNSIDSVVSSYVSLKRAGSNFNGSCPFTVKKRRHLLYFPQLNPSIALDAVPAVMPLRLLCVWKTLIT